MSFIPPTRKSFNPFDESQHSSIPFTPCLPLEETSTSPEAMAESEPLHSPPSLLLPLRQKWYRQVGCIIIVLLLYLVIIFGIPLLLRSDALSNSQKDAEEQNLNASRSLSLLKLLSREPHALYSKAHNAAMNILLEHISNVQKSSLQPFEVEVIQDRELIVTLQGQAHLLNPGHILIRMNGSQSSNALLLSCHYDSVVDSFGANDDGISVVSAVEVLTALSQKPEPPKYTLLIYINGNEEEGLLGALSLIAHPWWEDVRGFINLEAAGAGGRSMLFQANDESLVQLFASSSPIPHLNSIGNEVFNLGLIPSDTDYRVYAKVFGLSGLDIAFYENRGVYHTSFDNIHHISISSLAQMAVNLFCTCQAILESDFLNRSMTPRFQQLTNEWNNLSVKSIQEFNIYSDKLLPINSIAIFYDFSSEWTMVWSPMVAYTWYLTLASLLLIVILLTVLRIIPALRWLLIRQTLKTICILIGILLLTMTAVSFGCFLLSWLNEGAFGTNPLLMIYVPVILTLDLVSRCFFSYVSRVEKGPLSILPGSFKSTVVRLATLWILFFFLLMAVSGGLTWMSFCYPILWCTLPYLVQGVTVQWVFPWFQKKRPTNQRGTWKEWLFSSDILLMAVLNILPNVIVADLSVTLSYALSAMGPLPLVIGTVYISFLIFVSNLWVLQHTFSSVARTGHHLYKKYSLFYILVGVPYVVITLAAPNSGFYFPLAVSFKQVINWNHLISMVPNGTTISQTRAYITAQDARSMNVASSMRQWLNEKMGLENSMVQLIGMKQDLYLQSLVLDKETLFPFYYQSQTMDSIVNQTIQETMTVTFVLNFPMICHFVLSPRDQIEWVDPGMSLNSSSQRPIVQATAKNLTWWYGTQQTPMTVTFNFSKQLLNVSLSWHKLQVTCSHNDESQVPLLQFLATKVQNDSVAFINSGFKHVAMWQFLF